MLCSENTPHYELKNSKYRGHFSSHQEYFDVGFFFFPLLINNSCLTFWKPSLVQFVIITKKGNMHRTVRHITQNKQDNFPATSPVCLFWGPDWVQFDKRHPGLETVTKDSRNDDQRHETLPTRTIADTIVKYQQGQGFLFNTTRNERFKIQAVDIHTPSPQRRPLYSYRLQAKSNHSFQ